MALLCNGTLLPVPTELKCKLIRPRTHCVVDYLTTVWIFSQPSITQSAFALVETWLHRDHPAKKAEGHANTVSIASTE